jgi:hypothetical protein
MNRRERERERERFYIEIYDPFLKQYVTQEKKT